MNKKLLKVALVTSLVIPGITEVVNNNQEPVVMTVNAEESKKTYQVFTEDTLRALPNKNSAPTDVEVHLTGGLSVGLIEETNEEFFKVRVGGQEGYVKRGVITSPKNYRALVRGDKVKVSNVKVKKESNKKETYDVIESSIIRSRNVGNASPVRMVERGDKVKYLGTAGKDYFKVSYKGQKGYIDRGSITGDINSENNKYVDEKVVTENFEQLKAIVNTNIRTRGNKVSAPVSEGFLAKGKIVTYLGTVKRDNNWLKIEDERGVKGYVQRGQLTRYNKKSESEEKELENLKEKYLKEADNLIYLMESERLSVKHTIREAKTVKELKEKYKKAKDLNEQRKDEVGNEEGSIGEDTGAVLGKENLRKEIEKKVNNREKELEVEYRGEDLKGSKGIDDLIEEIKSVSSYNVGTMNLWKSSVEKDSNTGNDKVKIQFFYNTTDKEEDYITKEVKKVKNKVLKDGMSGFEVVEALHNYVVENMEYTSDTTNSQYSAYTAFKEGKGVCNAYVLMLARLLDSTGVENLYVIGHTTDGKYHAWNKVRMGDNWYNIDPTWAKKEEVSGKHGLYYYFMNSDERFYQTRIPRSKKGLPKGNSDKYDGMYDGQY